MTVCVADTNLIGFPTPRRFLNGLSIQLGYPFYTTPTVAVEGVRTIRRAEEIHWLERMKNVDLSNSVRQDVFAAVGEEAEAWAKELLDLDSGRFRQVCSTQDQRMEAALFTLEIPKKAFISPRTVDYAQDMAIVCEAIAGGADMMITKNISTIDHEMLNKWLFNSGFRNAPMLYSPDYGISELLGRNKAEYSHLAAITMGLSRTPRKVWDEHTSLLKFADRLKGSFSQLAAVIINEELTSTATPERWERGREYLLEEKWEQARRSEDDRIKRTQTAAREAGFDLEF